MICPHCGEDELVIIDEDLPWNVEHYQCPACDSTYTIDCIVQLAEQSNMEL